MSKTNANSSRNKYKTALKIFYEWMVVAGYSTQAVVDDVTKIKNAKQVPYNRIVREYLEKEELAEILEMCTSFTRRIPEQVQSILWFMFFSGVRRQELLNLKRSDFNFIKRQVAIRDGKGGIDRTVTFPKKIAKVGYTKSQDFIELLQSYFAIDVEEENAFNISQFQLYSIFDEVNLYAKNLGKKNITPHSLRHSFGRYLAKMGVGMREAQKWLGHGSISQTEIYFDVTLDTMQRNYDEKVK
jgi:site-specific recombinase XerD